MAVADRVQRHVAVDHTTGCWEWTGYRAPDRYGRIWWTGDTYRLAHRVSYEALVGPIPEGLQIDHLCRNRGCVNPDHLEPVTCRENVLRGEGPAARHAAKTHCDHGHPLSGSNVRTWISHGRPYRACQTCARRRAREAYERRRAA